MTADGELLTALTPPASARLLRAAAWTGFGGLVALAMWRLELNPLALLGGLGELGRLLSKMVPPHAGGHFQRFLAALLETLAMAVLGAALATAAALPLSLAASRSLAPAGVVRSAARGLLSLLRGVDTLIWALIFVSATGLGPAAGVLALAVSETGLLGKLFSEALDDADRRVADSVRAAGGGPLQALRYGILPQSLPVMADQSLYYLESNVRSATILGVVGAGGIGFELADRIRLNDWPQVGVLLLMILAAVAAVDWISSRISRRLIHGQG
jgi:phosphonate transport system permease protein